VNGLTAEIFTIRCALVILSQKNIISMTINTLLLTACIQVKNPSLVKRNDTIIRLADYIRTLKRWLNDQKSLTNIVFVENSGYRLDELQVIANSQNPSGKNIEFLQFEASGKSLTDKSYGELMIADYALSHSKLLQSAPGFVHASGRAFMSNIDKIINGLPDDFDVVSKFQNNLANSELNIFIVKTEFFKKQLLDYLKSNINEANKMYYERAFTKALHLALSRDYRWFPFCVEPSVVSIGGTKNMPIGISWIGTQYVNLVNHLSDRISRTSHGKNRNHLLELWKLKPDSHD
jgi:hypothetical protein